MEKAGIPELERRLIINLYWHQKATVRWDNESSKYVDIERGVRQGCIISAILYNLYSDMIAEAMKDESEIKFNGNYISNLRYADDAAFVSESKKKFQKMLDKLNSTCLDYGMAINVKKT